MMTKNTDKKREQMLMFCMDDMVHRITCSLSGTGLLILMITKNRHTQPSDFCLGFFYIISYDFL